MQYISSNPVVCLKTNHKIRMEKDMIKVILWDIDGTLMNFDKAENYAMKKCFELLALGECTDEMIKRYTPINRKYWERLERGEITKSEVLVERFQEFFASEGLDVSKAEAFNEQYQLRLGDKIFFCDDGDKLVNELKGSVKQYVVTNGTQVAQNRKLERSGLIEWMDGIFISDVIGAEKPDIRFFDKVFEEIGEYSKDEIMIVGDSLTSDMQGGNHVGIQCCWYNPKKIENKTSLHIDYEIQNLWQIENILKGTVRKFVNFC